MKLLTNDLIPVDSTPHFGKILGLRILNCPHDLFLDEFCGVLGTLGREKHFTSFFFEVCSGS